MVSITVDSNKFTPIPVKIEFTIDSLDDLIYVQDNLTYIRDNVDLDSNILRSLVESLHEKLVVGNHLS